eukprot:Pgem_evm1s13921
MNTKDENEKDGPFLKPQTSPSLRGKGKVFTFDIGSDNNQRTDTETKTADEINNENMSNGSGTAGTAETSNSVEIGEKINRDPNNSSDSKNNSNDYVTEQNIVNEERRGSDSSFTTTTTTAAATTTTDTAAKPPLTPISNAKEQRPSLAVHDWESKSPSPSPSASRKNSGNGVGIFASGSPSFLKIERRKSLDVPVDRRLSIERRPSIDDMKVERKLSLDYTDSDHYSDNENGSKSPKASPRIMSPVLPRSPSLVGIIKSPVYEGVIEDSNTNINNNSDSNSNINYHSNDSLNSVDNNNPDSNPINNENKINTYANSAATTSNSAYTPQNPLVRSNSKNKLHHLNSFGSLQSPRQSPRHYSGVELGYSYELSMQGSPMATYKIRSPMLSPAHLSASYVDYSVCISCDDGPYPECPEHGKTDCCLDKNGKDNNLTHKKMDGSNSFNSFLKGGSSVISNEGKKEAKKNNDLFGKRPSGETSIKISNETDTDYHNDDINIDNKRKKNNADNEEFSAKRPPPVDVEDVENVKEPSTKP